MPQPAEYRCPFCRLARLDDMRGDASVPDDLVYRDGSVTAFIVSAWWPANPGHVLVVPNEHYEEIYVIPDDLLTAGSSLANAGVGFRRLNRRRSERYRSLERRYQRETLLQ